MLKSFWLYIYIIMMNYIIIVYLCCIPYHIPDNIMCMIFTKINIHVYNLYAYKVLIACK